MTRQRSNLARRSGGRGRPRPCVGGFSLIELLVVIGIIAVLLAILLPSLGKARDSAMRAQDLSNLRGMQTAHWMYAVDNNYHMIDAGLNHGGSGLDQSKAWVATLGEYYGDELLHRSPVDDSPHWGPAPAGQPIPGASDPNQRRQTSYGVNNWLAQGNGAHPGNMATPPFNPIIDPPYPRIDMVPQPAVTVHFLVMAFEGDFAGADHPHVESWGLFGPAAAPAVAQQQVQINAHGGPAASGEAVSVYGFLDGHAEVRRFADVYTSPTENSFDPMVAQ